MDFQPQPDFKLPKPAETARILSKAINRPITEAMIRQDVADGMPLEPDGTVNFLTYAAWLVKQEFSSGK
jgi:hypothetical protein